jgi:hypothetical protein
VAFVLMPRPHMLPRLWHVLTVAALVTAQTPAPQTAGERYKSVRELKDIPASQIIPTMAFMANSLGVTCGHCHADDFASEAKPAKDLARAMIRMQRALNTEHYAGRTVITCQTCHNGRVIPAAAPAIENAGWNRSSPPPAAGSLPDAAALLDQNAKAMGGDAAYQRLTNRAVKGTVTRNNGRVAPVSASFELYQAKPSSARLSTELSHPPEGDVEVNASFVKPMLLRTAYREPRTIRRDRIGARDIIVVAATTANGATHHLWFDAETSLLLRRSDEIETVLGRLPEQYDFEDYRRVDGVMVPFRMLWSRADYQVTFRFDEVRHNVPPPGGGR